MRRVLLLLWLCTLPALAGDWVGTWAASPAPIDKAPRYERQTVREIVHVTLGGDQVRVRFTNAFGRDPLVIGRAHVALRAAGAAIRPESDRPLTFGGQAGVSIPPGASMLTDAVPLSIAARADLAISVYLPQRTPVSTAHWGAAQTSYLSNPGDYCSTDVVPVAKTIENWPFLSGVEVQAGAATRVVVAFGDSITDGAGSTTDANHRWPDRVAERLPGVSVLNAGIGGNRIWHDGTGVKSPTWGPNALSRFDRDVVAQAGVTDVVVLMGINDIQLVSMNPLEEVSADQIILGLSQLVDRAHEHHLRIYGGTIAPTVGLSMPDDAKRQAVNRWIRESGRYDGVIDFDAVLRDPQAPSQLRAAFDSGDHLHPNDAGYDAMGSEVVVVMRGRI